MSPEEFERKIKNREVLRKGLFVDGRVYLSYSKELTSLPVDLTVNGDFSLIGCEKLTSLHKGLTVVDGTLSFYRCTNLTCLPEGLMADTVRVSGNIENPAKFFCQLNTSLVKEVDVKGMKVTLNQEWIKRLYERLNSQFFRAVIMMLGDMNFQLPNDIIRKIFWTVFKN